MPTSVTNSLLAYRKVCTLCFVVFVFPTDGLAQLVLVIGQYILALCGAAELNWKK
jgi:hypothetical protein